MRCCSRDESFPLEKTSSICDPTPNIHANSRACIHAWYARSNCHIKQFVGRMPVGKIKPVPGSQGTVTVKPTLFEGEDSRADAQKSGRDVEACLLYLLERAGIRGDSRHGVARECALQECAEGPNAGLCSVFVAIALLWCLCLTWVPKTSLPLWECTPKTDAGGRRWLFSCEVPGNASGDGTAPFNGLIRFIRDAFVHNPAAKERVGRIPFWDLLCKADDRVCNPTFLFNVSLAYPEDAPDVLLGRVWFMHRRNHVSTAV